MRFGLAFVGLLTLPLFFAACTRSEPTPAQSSASTAPPARVASEAVLTSIAADAPTCGEAAAATCGDTHGDNNGEKACCGDHGAKKGGVQVAFETAPAHGDKALCLVMNREFVVDDRTSTSIYQGKTYAFCCDGCKQVFDENPAKFVHADAGADVKRSKTKT